MLVVNLVILLLPLAGIWILRLYESELIRQTESELIGQGAIVAAAYRDAWQRVRGEMGETEESAATSQQLRGTPVAPEWREQWDPRVALMPIQPRLDIARHEVHPAAPAAEPPGIAPDNLSLTAGEHMSPILWDAKRITLAGIRVMDHRGTVVASTGSGLGMSLAARFEVQQALEGAYCSLLRKREDEPTSPPLASISRGTKVRVFVAMPVVSDGRVVGVVALSRTPLDIVKAIYLSRHYYIGGAVVLLAVVLLVSVFISLTITRPVAALIRQAEGVSKGEMSGLTPLDKPGTREVAQLSEALAAMAVTLQKRADYIRTFASNVSHAFKTPLTSLRGTAELLQDHLHEMSPEERDRFLLILNEDAERLQRLVDRLLRLARAESLSPAEETADLPDLLTMVARRYRQTGLDVAVLCSADLHPVKIGEDALESIITALLDNSIQHGGEEVKVTIHAHNAVAGPPGVEMVYGDTGKGIPPAQAEEVFRPFFTTAGDAGGTGLGLAIVRALLTAHGGKICLEQTAYGTAFRISLPARDRSEHSGNGKLT